MENLEPYATVDGSATVRIEFEGSPVLSFSAEDLLLKSGINYVDFKGTIEDCMLWWPNGLGKQNLYQVQAFVEAGGVTVTSEPQDFGIRTININMDRISADERLFALEINGIKTYCKGADWVPADCIYGRVSNEKYATLIQEAADANFNMLRIWGGGIYEKDVFYQWCDRLGIMLWHDFMFSCAVYPDNLEWFRHEVEREAHYQTRRLRTHPAVVIWSGCNENNWGFADWWRSDPPSFLGGATCYNTILPEVVRRNCPTIPYWNGSPYGGVTPNSPSIGDEHSWFHFYMNSNVNVRTSTEAYDQKLAKFVSEYGYIGPPPLESITRYHGGHPVQMGGSIWNQHINRFEIGTTIPGINRQYTEKPDLSLAEYLLYGGLCQGTVYYHSLESMRSKEDCWGSLIWDYSDSWGEIGWSIIDYYATRKISWYFVRRALAHLKLVLREKDGIVRVTGINDTSIEHVIEADYGYVSFDGAVKALRSASLVLKPCCRSAVLEFERGAWDLTLGCIAIIPRICQADIAPAVLRSGPVKGLVLPEAHLTVSWVGGDSGTPEFDISSDAFAHALHFNLGAGIRLSDEYFDLLPGETRRIAAVGVPDGFDREMLRPEYVRQVRPGRPGGVRE